MKTLLGYSQLTPGQALPFDVLDVRGHILLRYGYVLKSQEQINRLIERQVYFDDIDEDVIESRQVARVSIYLRVTEIYQDYEDVLDVRHHETDYGAVLDIARNLLEACELDNDPALACILLQKGNHYSLRHSFNSAILTEVLLKQLGRTEEERCDAMAGALTMNIAMLMLQDELYHQNIKLTPQQKRDVVLHPSTAAAMLRKQGIDRPIWLDVVEHHHEMLDGTGYAKRLQGEALSLEAQVVSLADRYCAMVAERGYRAGTQPSTAVKELLTRQGATIDTALAAIFLKEIGIYPPGTVVLLANGEVAVVIKRTLNPTTPVVRSLRAPSGVRHLKPPKRLTSKPTYAIKEVLSGDQVRDFDLAALWIPAELDGSDEELEV